MCNLLVDSTPLLNARLLPPPSLPSPSPYPSPSPSASARPVGFPAPSLPPFRPNVFVPPFSLNSALLNASKAKQEREKIERKRRRGLRAVRRAMEGPKEREGEGEGEESGGDIAEMRWRMKGGKGGEEGKGMDDRPTDQGRKGRGNGPTGEMGNFQHTLCQNDIAAATARQTRRRPQMGWLLSLVNSPIHHSTSPFCVKTRPPLTNLSLGKRRERIKRGGVKCTT